MRSCRILAIVTLFYAVWSVPIGATCSNIPDSPDQSVCDHPMTGTLDIAFCLFRYDDGTPVGEPTTAEVIDMINDANQFNRDNSLLADGTTPGFQWNDPAPVWGFYDVPRPSVPIPNGASEDVENCLAAAYADGKTVEGFDHIVFMSAERDNSPGSNGVLQQSCNEVCQQIDIQGGPTVNVRVSWLYKLRYNVDHTHGGAIAHEVAHGYGLHHAQWQSSLSSRYDTYGNHTDVMGAQNSTMGHFQAAVKEQLGWIGSVTPVAVSGLYSIAPLEAAKAPLPPGVEHAIKIDLQERSKEPHVGDVYYYLEYRQQGNLPLNSAEGLIVNRVIRPDDVEEFPTGFGIDMTPETPYHQSFDGALPVGRSFVDLEEGLVLTNMGHDGTKLDVHVHFIADDPGNRAPTLASPVVLDAIQDGDDWRVTLDARNSFVDPEGDELVYFWNLGVDWYQQTNGRTDEGYDPAANGGVGNYGHGDYLELVFPDDSPRRFHLKVSDKKGGETEWIEIDWGTVLQNVIDVAPGQTIQAAIDLADDGDLVRVPVGVYSGPGNVNLRLDNKRITVRGEGAIIDAGGATGPGDRAFIFDQVETPYSVVEGFTLLNGHKTGSGNDGLGGAILVSQISRPTIRGNIFFQNSAVSGGAIAVTDWARPTVVDNDFYWNTASQDGGAVHARATELQYGTSGISNGTCLVDCVNFHSGTGGIVLANNTFGFNSAVDDGGALFYVDEWGFGNHLRYHRSGLTLRNNEMVSNTANRGGAIRLAATRKQAEITGNTLDGNTPGGVSMGTIRPETVFRNSILWDSLPFEDPAQIDWFIQQGDLTLDHTIIRNGWPGDPAINPGVSTADPLFVDPAMLDYTVQPFSPAIDAARSAVGISEEDLEGLPRFDDTVWDDRGQGGISYADIGANERQENSSDHRAYFSVGFLEQAEKLSWEVGEFTGESFSCSHQLIHVGHVSGTIDRTFRSFMDFDTDTLAAGKTIRRVELDLSVFSPISEEVEVRSLLDRAENYAGPSGCMNLYGAISTTNTYLTTDNLTSTGTHRLALNSVATSDFQSGYDLGKPWFSLGLKLEDELQPSLMELNQAPNVLWIYYDD